MKYEELGSNKQSKTWNDKNLAVGAEIEGRYIEKKTNVGPHKSNLYIIEDNKKTQWAVWGSTVIDGKFDVIALGKMIKIRFEGIQEGKSGKQFKAFTFYQGVDYPEDEGKVYNNIKSGPGSIVTPSKPMRERREPIVQLDEETEEPFDLAF